MLILFGVSDGFHPIMTYLSFLGIGLNAIIYKLLSFAYQVFFAIASARVLRESTYIEMANKIYLVIGVISLFLVAYGLLQAIINPDNAGKGDTAVNNLVGKVVMAIALIAFVPTIFNYGYKLQEVVIKNNVIGNVILHGSDVSSSDVHGAGNEFANSMFMNFFMPVDDKGEPDCLDVADESFTDCLNKIESDSSIFESGSGLGNIYKEVGQDGNFLKYGRFAENVADGQIDFNFLIMLLVGIFITYVFISFCIDMGLRAVKLAYYQIIAPIPILTIIIPGQKKIFDNWKKSSISTFAEVFIRIMVVYFTVFLIKALPNIGDNFWNGTMGDDLSISVKLFARIFIILGLLMFMKQAPKLLGDMFGIQGGSFKLGIRDKLKEATDFSKVPVVGRAQGLVNKGAGKVQGATTGALGAAWSSKVNGGSFKEGLKYGAAQGLKGGGNQFNKQRQGVYSAMGHKGTAGWFGGQNLIEKIADDTKNKYTDDYKYRILSEKINKAENYKDANAPITKYFNDEYNTRLTKHNEEMAKLKKQYDDSLKKLADVQALNTKEFNDAHILYNAQKTKTIADLENKANEEFAIGNYEAANQLQAQIETVKNGKFEDTDKYKSLQKISRQRENAANKELDYSSSNLRQKNAELNEKNVEFTRHIYNPDTGKLETKTELVSKLEKDAFDASVKTLRDKDVTFARDEKVFKAKIQEKDTEEWLRSAEGQHMTAALGRGFDRMSKEGKFPKPDAPKDGNKS